MCVYIYSYLYFIYIYKYVYIHTHIYIYISWNIMEGSWSNSDSSCGQTAFDPYGVLFDRLFNFQHVIAVTSSFKFVENSS